MVFENAVLFLRDALILREFTDAIKSGDMGRVMTVLKVWALAFRGSGRRNYAYEVLHFIHNVTQLWPAGLKEIILKNCLLNPTGKPNAWVPVDLVQEHLNFWIKTVYKAHGSNASWNWLATVSPCVNILRRLATQINSELGSHQGTKHHAPDLTRDIDVLRRSLRDHNVYVIEHGRSIEGDKAVVPDTIADGLGLLQTPLEEYNNMFRKLQQRRRIVPLLGGLLVRHQGTEGGDNSVGDLVQGGLDETEAGLSELIEDMTLDCPLRLETEEDVDLDMD